MAEISGASQTSVSAWEKGTREPDLRNMEAIRAEALRRGIEWDDRWFFDAAAIPSVAA
jgi:transcriptional regulator with XRE-family HTH domain